MRKTVKAAFAFVMVLAASTAVFASPSTQIWIPSTDVQPFGTAHLNLDTYVRTTSKGGWPNTISMGPTVGILPFEKVQAEIGFDYIDTGTTSEADHHPLYFHGKLGTPEDSLFKNSPAIAFGGYNFGTDAGVTNQNMVYGLLAKTLPVVGRLSAGYYQGSKTVLRDENGNKANNGVLLSWDRTLSEISDKLWSAVDYQGGDNFNSSLNFGVSWAFSKNVSVIFGYDIYTNAAVGGKNTFTTQVDINFP